MRLRVLSFAVVILFLAAADHSVAPAAQDNGDPGLRRMIELRIAIDGEEQKLQVLRERYTEDHPDVRAQRTRVESMNSELRKLLSAREDLLPASGAGDVDSVERAYLSTVRSKCERASVWRDSSGVDPIRKENLAPELFFDGLTYQHRPEKVWSASGFAELLTAYRQCIDRQVAEIDSDPRYPARLPNSWDSGIPSFSWALQTKAGLLANKARSYLYHFDTKYQDALQARVTFEEAMRKLQGDFELGEDQMVAYYEERARRSKSERDREVVGGLIGAIVVGGLVGADGSAIQGMARASAQRAKDAYQRQVSGIPEVLSALRSSYNNASGARWSDDGIRLHMFAIGAGASAGTDAGGPWGFFEHDHSHGIVRIRRGESFCTGAIVGRYFVLTNQHCVRDKFGSPVSVPITVHQEVLVVEKNAGASGQPSPVNLKVRDISEDGWVVDSVSPETGNWQQHSEHDWVVLTLKTHEFDHWLQIASLPADAPSDELPRVALAGYSGDLDDGMYVTMDWGCKIEDVSESLLKHGCRRWKGASGSPVVAIEGPLRGKIVSVHAAQTTVADRDRGMGPATSSIRQYLTKAVREAGSPQAQERRRQAMNSAVEARAACITPVKSRLEACYSRCDSRQQGSALTACIRRCGAVSESETAACPN
jgi:V8-like Glu-specific endopeptidase